MHLCFRDSQIGIKEWKIPRQITERFSCISSFEAAHIMEMVFSTMRIIEEEDFVSRCFGNTHPFRLFRSALRILSVQDSRYHFSTRRTSFDLYRQYLFVIGRRNWNSKEDVQAPKRRLSALLCVTPGRSETLSTLSFIPCSISDFALLIYRSAHWFSNAVHLLQSIYRYINISCRVAACAGTASLVSS